MIGPNVKIGAGSKIQNNVSIYEGVELGRKSFLWSILCIYKCYKSKSVY